MTITAYPQEFSGAYAPQVLYTIAGAGDAPAVEIGIVDPHDADRLIGAKRFSGSGPCEVNVAGYYRRLLNPRPVFSPGISLLSPAGRHTVCRIRIGGELSRPTTLSAGSRRAEPFTLLSQAPRRLAISPGQWDELSFFAPGATFAAEIKLSGAAGERTIDAGSYSCGEGLSALVLDTDGVAAGAGSLCGGDSMRLELRFANGAVIGRDYVIEPRHGRQLRLCWLNELGGIDYYSFSAATGEKLTVTKSRARNGGGLLTYAATAERSLTVTSDYESPETMRWLQGVLYSPRVWIAGGAGAESGERFVEVDVMTDKADFGMESPAALAVTLRRVDDKTICF